MEKMDSQETITLTAEERELIEVLLNVSLWEAYAILEAEHSDGTWESEIRLLATQNARVDLLNEVTRRFITELAILKKARLPAALGVFVNLKLWQPMFS